MIEPHFSTPAEETLIGGKTQSVKPMTAIDHLEKLVKWYEDSNRFPIKEKRKTQFDRMCEDLIMVSNDPELKLTNHKRMLKTIYGIYKHERDPAEKTYLDTIMGEIKNYIENK